MTRGKGSGPVARYCEVGSWWLPNDCALLRHAALRQPALRLRYAEIDVADRPQDQPKPLRSGLPAPLRSAEIGAREVVAYLREHPDFLDRGLKDRAYIAGADYTVADITALVAVDFMRVSKMAVPDGLSNLQRWHKAVSARPSAAA